MLVVGGVVGESLRGPFWKKAVARDEREPSQEVKGSRLLDLMVP